jgi:hypothetical protein
MTKPGYLEQSFWLRLLFMLLYWVLLNIALSLFGVLVLLATVIRFGSQHEPKRIAHFQFSLTQFIYQTMDFLTFRTDEKPFPFRMWPQVNDNEQF